MSLSFRIVIADGDPTCLEDLEQCLSGDGHQIVGAVSDGRPLIELCRTLGPDLLVCDTHLPGVDGVRIATELFRHRPTAILLTADTTDSGTVERAAAAPILGYLIKPVGPENLLPAARIAVRRFAELEAMHREVEGLRRALQDRKVIERAKGVLMQKSGLGEADAFRRLQQMARNSNRRLAEIAGAILTAEEACHPAGL